MATKRKRPQERSTNPELDYGEVYFYGLWLDALHHDFDARADLLNIEGPFQMWRRYRPQLLAYAIRTHILQYVVDFLDSGGQVREKPDLTGLKPHELVKFRAGWDYDTQEVER